MSKLILRPYQRDAVSATVQHFKTHDTAAVIVLPTGAGKSLVIAELAAIANYKVLVLAHVKELVEQNQKKFELYGLKSSVFSGRTEAKRPAAPKWSLPVSSRLCVTLSNSSSSSAWLLSMNATASVTTAIVSTPPLSKPYSDKTLI